MLRGKKMLPLRRDIKTLYAVVIVYALALLPPLFVTDKLISNLLLAVITVAATAGAFWFVRKRTALDIRYKEATLICFVAALVGVMALYLLGLRFGFMRTGLAVSTIYTYVLPIAVAIVSGEILRRIFLSQKKTLVSVISYFAFVALEAALFAAPNALHSSSAFMSFFGLSLLPAVTSNFLYHELSAKYGAYPVIPYRFVTALYSYLLPFEPAVPSALLGFLKIVFPLVLLWFIRLLYVKRTVRVSRRSKAMQTVATVLSALVMLVSVSFVAGLFSRKMIVVATGSMTGALDIGDVVVYDDYDGQIVENGQIVLFDRDGTIVIHRVVDIQNINGVCRYYTKGDANDSRDSGYITDGDLVGVVKMKIPYLGYPTVWIHDLFK